ncbi:MAG TPA: sialidase family protein [Humisphaera sp.]|nr:sialidase family protein [Humisphaera sp.]
MRFRRDSRIISFSLRVLILILHAHVLLFTCTHPATAADLPNGVSQNLVLAPGPNNPRNSEGDFAVLGDGRVLFVYTRFTGGTGDADAAELVSRLSTDGGRTWSARDELVVARPAGAQNIMSVSILPLRDGRLAMFYLEKKSAGDCRAVMRVSTDGAKSWSEPRECMPEAGYFVVNNGRAIQLADGRIILPAARHDAAADKPGWHRGVAVCFFSDDGGLTWHRSDSALEAPPQSRSGLQEPLVAELKDGRLLMLCRTDQGFLFRSYSQDRGQTWSAPEPSDLASPLSPASLKRIPKTGDLLLVWNDHTAIDAAHRGKRTPLTVAISNDEGKTWTHRKTLYDDPQGWYCYCAIAFVGERVLLGHCAGLQTKMSSGLTTTVVTSFGVDWLYR